MAKVPFTSHIAKQEADAYWEKDVTIVVCIKVPLPFTVDGATEFIIGKHYKLKKLQVPSHDSDYVMLSEIGHRFWSNTYTEYFISLTELRDDNIDKIIN